MVYPELTVLAICKKVVLKLNGVKPLENRKLAQIGSSKLEVVKEPEKK